MFGLENHLSTAQLPKGLHDRWQTPFTARPAACTRLDVPHCHIRWDERELNQKRGMAQSTVLSQDHKTQHLMTPWSQLYRSGLHSGSCSVRTGSSIAPLSASTLSC